MSDLILDRNEKLEAMEESVKPRSGNLSMTEDFTDPKELYDHLIEKVRRYHPSDDISMIEKAFRVADKAHEGQRRKSGEAYIIHPLSVSLILA